MKLALPVALILMVLAMSCDAVLGINLATYSCEELKDRVIELSEEQQNPFSPLILKVSEIEETSRTAERLNCHGIARLNNGAQEGIVFHIEEDVDGDFFYGYEVAPKPIQRDPTPTPTFGGAVPTGAQQNSLPTLLLISTPIPSPTPEESGTPNNSSTVEAYRATLVAIAAATPSTPNDEMTPIATVFARAAAPCCISVGFTQEEVIDILGEPDSTSQLDKDWEINWFYYNSTISFDPKGKRVNSWYYEGPLNESPISVLASITSAPLSNPEGRISVGSTADEVVSILGDPDSASQLDKGWEINWFYYNSTISFDPKGKRVNSWYYEGPLNESPISVLASITSATLSNPEGRISVGSTADEVVSILGDPDSASQLDKDWEINWFYYNSTISFDPKGKRVTDWYYDGPEDESPFR